jgi:choline kinase
MLNINSKNKIIDQQISSIKTIHRNAEITISCGFEYEKINNYINKRYKNIQLIHNKDYETTNEARDIELFLIDKKPDDIDYLFIISGGVLLKKKAISFTKIKKSSRIFLMRSVKNNFKLGCSKKDNIEYVFYDLDIPWCECLLLNKESVIKLKSFIQGNNVLNMYLFEMLNSILTIDDIQPCYINKNDIMKITSFADITRAKSFIT